MSIAMTIESCLAQQPVHFDLLHHRHSSTSLQAARECKVPAHRLAKAVVLEDEDRRYFMAVLPATHQIEFDALQFQTGRRMHLVDEDELTRVFSDCEVGAVPPLGGAYGVETMWDDCLIDESDLYFEAGDHQTLVHVSADDFLRLLGDVDHSTFSMSTGAAAEDRVWSDSYDAN